MAALKAKLSLLLAQLLSYFPRKLPVGLTEFHEWADRIIAQAGKFADDTSMRFALASMIIHIDSKVNKMSDQYFIRCLHKSAANQVSSQVFQDIKTQQQEAQKAAQQAEATATQSVADDQKVP